MRLLAPRVSALIAAGFLMAVTRAAPVLALPSDRPPVAARSVDRLVVLKKARRMELFAGARRVRVYRIALGFAPVGHKQRQGDGKTPEGVYRIDLRNPRSRFYRSVRISYPNARDRAVARRRGVSPGGDIYIHGQPNGLLAAAGAVLRRDWTAGCIAVSNRNMSEIWRLVRLGAVIEIRP